MASGYSTFWGIAEMASLLLALLLLIQGNNEAVNGSLIIAVYSANKGHKQ